MSINKQTENNEQEHISKEAFHGLIELISTADILEFKNIISKNIYTQADLEASGGKVDDFGMMIHVLHDSAKKGLKVTKEAIDVCFDSDKLTELYLVRDSHRANISIFYGFLQAHLLMISNLVGSKELYIGSNGLIYAELEDFERESPTPSFSQETNKNNIN